MAGASKAAAPAREARRDAIREILSAADLEARLGSTIKGGMLVKVQAVLHALASGVRAVHVVDGRQPHSVIAELFTDRGVGTLVT